MRQAIIDIDLIEPSTGSKTALNISLTPDEIEEAKTKGIVRPVVVTPIRGAGVQRYRIIATSRSWLLAQAIGASRVPACVHDDISEAIDDPSVNKTEPMRWAEQAKSEIKVVPRGAWRYRGVTKYAARLGVARSTAGNRIRLLSLVDSVQQMLREGKIKEGHAKALVALSSEAQVRLARLVFKQKLSVRKTEVLVRTEMHPVATQPAQSRHPTEDRDTARLNKLISDACGAKVSIENGTMIVLCGEDVDVLSGILHKLKLAGTGCRATIDGPRLIVDYANDFERLDVLLRNVGVTDF